MPRKVKTKDNNSNSIVEEQPIEEQPVGEKSSKLKSKRTKSISKSKSTQENDINAEIKTKTKIKTKQPIDNKDTLVEILLNDKTDDIDIDLDNDNDNLDTKVRNTRVSYAELDAGFQKMEQKLVDLKSTIGDMMVMFRDLRKKQRKYAREVSRKGHKKNKTIEEDMLKPKQKPKGFQVPLRISNELCEFLNIDEGTKMNRAEAGKGIHVYIKNNNLQDTNNGTVINMDNKLKSLLQVEKDTQLTYFNLQKYLNKHFIKDD